jgi:hypothetical protein
MSSFEFAKRKSKLTKQNNMEKKKVKRFAH